MKLPSIILMNKVEWTNRYSERLIRLFEIVHLKWLDETNINFGSVNHNQLTDLKNRINFKLNLLSRYSSKLTTQALKEMNN